MSVRTPPLTGLQADAEQRSGVEAVAEALRGLGHEVIEREIEYELDLGSRVLSRYLRGITDLAREMPHPERLSRRTRGYRRLGAAIPAAFVEWSRASAAADEAVLGRVFDDGVHAVLTPVFTRRPPAVGEYEGRGAVWCFLGVGAAGAVLRGVQPHGPAGRLGAGDVDAGRLPGRGAAGGAARRRAAPAGARRPARGRARVAGPATGDGVVTPGGLREIAEAVAREAGRQLRDAFAGPLVNVTAKSSPTDLVSEADHAAERLIRDRLAAARPGDGFLGEEGGNARGTSGLRWVVDPLDGTVNFLFGIPQWAVSIACEDTQGTLAGVIYDPMRDELWSAERDGPALLDGRPIRASARDDLATALVATGFGYDAEVRRLQAGVAARLLPRVRDIRRLGSAALDLAWTAAGRYDAYYERGLNAWDVAAGELLCVSAGLAVRELAPSPPAGAGVLVAPHAIIDELESIVA